MSMLDRATYIQNSQSMTKDCSKEIDNLQIILKKLYSIRFQYLKQMILNQQEFFYLPVQDTNLCFKIAEDVDAIKTLERSTLVDLLEKLE